MTWYVVMVVLAYVSLAYIVLPPLREAFQGWVRGRHSRVVPKSGDVTSDAAPAPQVVFPPIPEAIEKYAASWIAEPWVAESVIERAKALYVEHGNWDVVFQELLKQDGEE